MKIRICYFSYKLTKGENYEGQENGRCYKSFQQTPASTQTEYQVLKGGSPSLEEKGDQ